MFYPIALLAFVFFARPTAVDSQVSTKEASEKQETQMEKPSQEEPKKKFKITKNMVNIDPLTGKVTAKVGQQLVYSADVHGSVGYSASVSSSSGQWLPLMETHLEYDDDERAKMCGGDAATKYFIFEAKKAGTYEIQATHYFRGDLEHEFIIVITVE